MMFSCSADLLGRMRSLVWFNAISTFVLLIIIPCKVFISNYNDNDIDNDINNNINNDNTENDALRWTAGTRMPSGSMTTC